MICTQRSHLLAIAVNTTSHAYILGGSGYRNRTLIRKPLYANGFIRCSIFQRYLILSEITSTPGRHRFRTCSDRQCMFLCTHASTAAGRWIVFIDITCARSKLVYANKFFTPNVWHCCSHPPRPPASPPAACSQFLCVYFQLHWMQHIPSEFALVI